MPPVNLISPEGDAVEVDDKELPSYLMAGFEVETAEQATKRAGAAANAEQFGGTGSAIEAGIYGAARGATFGLSDVALRAGGADPAALRGLKEQQKGVSIGTEIAGAVVPTLLSGGTGAVGSVARATPAGATSKLAIGITERVAGQAPGTARRIAGTAVGGAAEGAIQNVGSYVSDVALQNKKLSAEGFLGAAGTGGAFGGVAGGAFGGIEKGTIAARRLFPRSEAGERVVEAAEQQFLATADDVVRSGDDLARTAQQRLDDIGLRRAELQLEKLKLKGQTDPAAAERLAQIRVEQAQIKIARREASAEVASQRAAKAGASPTEVAPLAPDADGIVPTVDDVAAVTAAAPAPVAAPAGDDLLAQLQGTQAQLDAGVPFNQIGQSEEALDEAIRQADAQAARLQDKLERFKQGKPMAEDFMARYGKGAKSSYSATGAGGTKGGGAGPVRTDRTRLLPEEEVEASINDRVFAGIGADRAPAAAPSNVREFDAGGKKLRIEAKTKKLPNGKEELHVTSYRTLGDGEEVESATAAFAVRDGELYPNNVTVEPALQRKGVASQMYDLAEQYTGKKIIPSASQTPEGKALSEAFRSRRGGAAPAESAADRLHRAFVDLGGDKSAAYVDMYKLRNALPDVSPDDFKGAINELRRRRVLSADSFQGQHSKMTPEIQAGMLREGDESFALVQRGPKWEPPSVKVTSSTPIPDGWTADELFPKGPKEVRRGVPAPKEVADDVAYVVRPSELADSGKLYGNPKTAGDTKQQIRDEWSSGEKLSPVDIDIDDAGRMFVRDGNHRLQVAAETDKPMLVRFTRGKDRGLKESDRVLTDMPSTTGPRGAELDAAYEEAIERAAAAPNRAAQERALREAADLEDQIFDTVATRGGRDAADVDRIRNKRGDLGQDSYTVALRRAEKRAMAEEAKAPSSRTLDEREDLAAFDRGLREQQFAGGKTAGEVAAELRKPLADRILGEMPSAAAAKPTQAQGLGKFIDDADEAIRTIGELEKATAELVKELGDAAPPKSKVVADQYWMAVDDQARKVAAKTAMSADDIVRAGSLMTLPKAPLVPVSEARRLGKGVADAAAVLDTIQTFGDIPGMPNPRDIPVIGPVLSLYLKVRAGRMALKRIGGRIPATAEAKVAAKSAELRDRAAAVVDRILVGASKTARVARQPAVAAGTKLMDSLSHSLYPQEGRKEKPKTPADAVKERVRELSAAVTDPDGVRSAIRTAIKVADPDLAAAIEDATIAKLSYLHKHAPKMPPPGLLAGKAWAPNKVEIEKFARRIRATEDPVSVLDELEAGTLTAEAAEAMRTVYPTLFSEVQMRLIDRAAELEVTVPYKRRLTLSALFDVPLDDSLQPARLLQLQQIYNSGGASPDAAGAAPGGPQPPVPSVAAPISISNMYGDQRRSNRS